jgi:hypothetical protein
LIHRTLIAGIMSLLFATPALSLSCMRPDVKYSFQQAAEAEETYIVARGTLTFSERKLPEAVGNDSPPQTLIPAHLKGWGLSDTGFNVEFDQDITLEVLCFGPWCGGAGSGKEYLVFLRKDNDGYTMIADPCASMVFQDPSTEMLDTVAACFKAGACPN